MIIEKMKLSNFKDLRALWGKAGLHLAEFERGQYELDQLMNLNPNSCLVAKEDGQIIGSVIGAFNGRRAWIYHMAIDPYWQKKGYGSMLLNEIERALKKKGVTKILLGVLLTNLKVVPFWEKHGYNVMDDAIVMEKDLWESRKI